MNTRIGLEATGGSPPAIHLGKLLTIYESTMARADISACEVVLIDLTHVRTLQLYCRVFKLCTNVFYHWNADLNYNSTATSGPGCHYSKKKELTVILFNSAGLLTAETVDTICSKVGASLSRIVTISSVDGPAAGMCFRLLLIIFNKWPGGGKGGQVSII